LEIKLSNKIIDENPDDLSLSDFMPDVSNGYMATAGVKLNENSPKADELKIIDALMEIKDPEIPVNIYDLGLIYTIERHAGGDVDITMSLTAPGCPVAGEMPGQVARCVAELEDVGLVQVTLVWEPPWAPDRMSEDAKLALDYGF
jgi:FeS assembly SUF system protein